MKEFILNVICMTFPVSCAWAFLGFLVTNNIIWSLKLGLVMGGYLSLLFAIFLWTSPENKLINKKEKKCR